MTTRLTKQDRIALERLKYHTWLLDGDDWDATMALYELTPRAWHTLMADIDCEEPKEKVTLYLDKSVARTVKAMGKGYQARINRLLQTWLAMKAAGKLEAAEQIWAFRGEAVARKEQIRREGGKAPIIVQPGDTPPTEEPPEVDW